jgi:hypothetical protein
MVAGRSCGNFVELVLLVFACLLTDCAVWEGSSVGPIRSPLTGLYQFTLHRLVNLIHLPSLLLIPRPILYSSPTSSHVVG